MSPLLAKKEWVERRKARIAAIPAPAADFAGMEGRVLAGLFTNRLTKQACTGNRLRACMKTPSQTAPRHAQKGHGWGDESQ